MTGSGVTSLRWNALLVVLAVLPVLPSLGDPFVADDYLHITRLEELHSGSLDRILRSWTLRAEDSGTWWTPPSLSVEYLRPLISLSFFLDHSLWGLNSFGFRLSNLVLHGLATLLCLALARRILGGGFSAWAAAALFALHPCHAEAVLWVSARTDLLATLFYCAALLLFAEGQSSPRYLVLALVCAAFALLAKETAVSLPAVLLLWNLLIRPEQPLARRWLAPALAAALVLAYLALRLWLFGGFHAPPFPLAHRPADPDFFSHILTAPWLYLADLVFFIPLDAAVTHPFWTSHFGWFILLAALALMALVSTLRSAPERRIAVFGLGWLVMTIAPVLPAAVGERYLYLPSVGYCILVAAKLPHSFSSLGRRGRREVIALLALVGLLALGKTIFFHVLAIESRKPVDGAIAALDAAPDASLLLVIDLPVTSALAFPHPVRLQRPERDVDVQVLSVAADVLNTMGRTISSVTCPEPGRLVLRRTGTPFLASYAERAFLGNRPPFRTGDSVELAHFSVHIREARDGLVQAFEVRLPQADPLGVLILQGTGFDLHRIDPCGTP